MAICTVQNQKSFKWIIEGSPFTIELLKSKTCMHGRARLWLQSLCPLWLWLVCVHLPPAGIPAASSLMLLGLLAPTVGAAARSMFVAAMFWRTTSSSNFGASRSFLPDAITGGGR